MTTRLTGIISAGAVSGLVCFAIALIRGSALLPLVAPLLGGAIGVAVLPRAVERTRWFGTSDVLDSAGIGAVAALFFLVPASGTLLAMSRVQVPWEFSTRVAVPHTGGWDGDLVVALGIFGLIGIPFVTLIGAMAARRLTSRVQ